MCGFKKNINILCKQISYFLNVEFISLVLYRRMLTRMCKEYCTNKLNT